MGRSLGRCLHRVLRAARGAVRPRPVVGAERRSGQTGAVGQVGVGIIGPGITHGHGGGNLGAGNHDCGAFQAGVGPVRILRSAAAMAKPRRTEPALRSGPRRCAGSRSGWRRPRCARNRTADRSTRRRGCRLSERPEGQAISDLGLAMGVNVAGFAQSQGHRQTGIRRILQGQELGLTQLRPVALGRLVTACFEFGQLDDQEWKIALVPGLAPALDEGRQERAVLEARPALPSPWYQMAPRRP